MIIFEGPDGAGKTTLIRSVSRFTGLNIAPRVVSKEAEALVDIKAWVEENVRGGFQYTLFDRHRLISEFIYGPVLRDEQEAGFTELTWVWDVLSELYSRVKPVIIYSLPPLEVVKANVANDSDNSVVAKFIEPIYTAYLQRAAMDMLLNPKYTILHDYTEKGHEEGYWEGLIVETVASRKDNK